jgi:TRAP-type C4-dicarboxylate transport system permease small subunit
MKDQITRIVSWILVVDLGLVLLSLGWFTVAVVGRSMNVNLGLEVWYDLWNPLFLPALSVLMTGAIASGIMGWISKKLDALKSKSEQA